MKYLIWLKWSATVILIAGSVLNGLNWYPVAQLVLLLGGAGWFIAAWLQRDHALMTTNGIMNLAVIAGLVYNLLF
jgi:hypothetical protein